MWPQIIAALMAVGIGQQGLGYFQKGKMMDAEGEKEKTRRTVLDELLEDTRTENESMKYKLDTLNPMMEEAKMARAMALQHGGGDAEMGREVGFAQQMMETAPEMPLPVPPQSLVGLMRLPQ
jgi:hypothetical protein